ncbi:MAG: DUF5996 family protein [Chloroflexota bacterium]|nr:DUF5996 family protein [Chloroflexota bacterium]
MVTTNAMGSNPAQQAWPELVYRDWRDTYDTLHLYLQMAGKVKLELCPFLNQWWEVALQVSARGITSGPIPWRASTFDIEFDFIDHRVVIRSSNGQSKALPLTSVPVAEFYQRFMAALDSLGIEVRITTMPSEIPDAIPFDSDTIHASYDGEYASRWWQIALATERVINQFRTPFHGKSSPVNLFWGAFDLSHSRFNGEPAETSPAADRMMRYGENEANFAVGFWPGGEAAEAAFYAYMTPAPAGIEDAQIEPQSAQYVPAMGEFFLPYEAARRDAAPEEAVLTFFQSSYDACANLAGWNRAALEGDVPQLERTG